MPIELPNLDDRRFAEMVEEGKRLIPSEAPSWTDHNPSDPGITIIELFAAIAEMLMYRVNRISEPNKRAFVRLLAPDRTPTPGWTVDQEIGAAVKDLRIEHRAVTAADIERLVLQVPGVARAHCLARRNLEAGASGATDEALGHISVVVLCTPDAATAPVMAAVKTLLDQRCLLTTRPHVGEPPRLPIAVNLTLRVQPDQLREVVQQRALLALAAFFDPVSGGADRRGWPFGAPVYRSDVYALMDQVDGVDYVDVAAQADDLFVLGGAVGERRIQAGPSYVGLRLESHELVAFSSAQSTIVCQNPDSNIPG